MGLQSDLHGKMNLNYHIIPYQSIPHHTILYHTDRYAHTIASVTRLPEGEAAEIKCSGNMWEMEMVWILGTIQQD